MGAALHAALCAGHDILRRGGSGDRRRDGRRVRPGGLRAVRRRQGGVPQRGRRLRPRCRHHGWTHRARRARRRTSTTSRTPSSSHALSWNAPRTSSSWETVRSAWRATSGLEFVDDDYFIPSAVHVPEVGEPLRPTGTVGAVALDAAGNRGGGDFHRRHASTSRGSRGRHADHRSGDIRRQRRRRALVHGRRRIFPARRAGARHCRARGARRTHPGGGGGSRRCARS